jgi:hypothetical protein
MEVIADWRQPSCSPFGRFPKNEKLAEPPARFVPLQSTWNRSGICSVAPAIPVGAARLAENERKETRMLRQFRHWPKAAIAIGALLTIVWTGLLLWLVARTLAAVI